MDNKNNNSVSLRRMQKVDNVDADVTCWGRLFQTRAAATGKARSP